MKDKGTENAFSRYIDPISDYMKNVCDYAFFLDGRWGSGKTHFVMNELKNALSANKVKIVHTSLAGKTSINQVNGEALWSVFSDSGLPKRIISEIFGKTDSDKSNLKFVIDILGKTSSALMKSKLRKDALGRETLFVFDDLERCKPEILQNILCEISSQYLEIGLHVLLVADESRMTGDAWNWFRILKEKIVRQTLSFSHPDIVSMLGRIIRARSECSPVRCLYDSSPAAFDEFVSVVSSITNIRTWLTAFDYYDTICIKCGFKDDAHICLELFCLVLLTTFFKRERSDDGNTKDIEGEVSSRFHIQCISRFDLYSRDFYYRFAKTQQLKFVRLESLISYVDTGFCDATEIRKEFDYWFSSVSEAEKCRLSLFDYEEMTEEEMKVSLSGVYRGLAANEYSLEKIVELSRLFELFEEIGYIDVYGDCFLNYKDLFINAVDNIPSENIGDYFYRDDLSECKYYSYEGTTLRVSLDNLFRRFREKKESEKRRAFEDIVHNLGNQQGAALSNLDEGTFLARMSRYDLFSDVLEMQPRAIAVLSSYIKSITGELRDEHTFRMEEQSLKELGEFLEENLAGLGKSKRSCDLGQLQKLIAGVSYDALPELKV